MNLFHSIGAYLKPSAMGVAKKPVEGAEMQPDTLIIGGKTYKVATEVLKVKEEALSDKLGRAFTALSESQIVKVAMVIAILRLIDVAQHTLLKQVPVHCKDLSLPGIDNPEELAAKVINDTAMDLRQSMILTRSQLFKP